jgi:hypothetical protein
VNKDEFGTDQQADNLDYPGFSLRPIFFSRLKSDEKDSAGTKKYF